MSKNTVNIRPAVINDLATLLVFEQGIIKTEQPLDPFLKQGDTTYYNIPEMIASKNVQLLVAEINTKIIGSGYAKIVKSKPYHINKSHSYVGFMYVSKKYRGQKISQEILKELKKWSIAQGVKEMRLDVYDNNKIAVNAYKKFGFLKSLLNMRIDLEKQNQ